MEAAAVSDVIAVEDTIGGDADKLPASVRKVLAYATGGPPIEWTQAQAEVIEKRGGRVIWVDQSDGTVTRLGDVDDVEKGAKTIFHAIAKSVARKKIGWHSCIYLSLTNLAQARQLVDNAGLKGWVTFDVADWGITRDQAIGRLGGDIGCVQYASPSDQGGLLIPGSDVTLAAANADLSVSLASWFPLPKPAPAPAPAPDPELMAATITFDPANKGWDIRPAPAEKS